MEFNELQALWNQQDEQNLYQINLDALYDKIQRKGRSINRTINFLEAIMIGVNFIAGIILVVDAFTDQEHISQYFLAAFYIAFSCVALGRRLTRRRQEQLHFEPTIRGELDKAIWQMEYIIQQINYLMRWYVFPLIIAFAINSYFDDKPPWFWGFILFWAIFTYYGGRWEINKFHRPKKEALIALRQELITLSDQASTISGDSHELNPPPRS